MGPFELLTDGSDLPVFAFKLRDDVTGYSVFDLSDRLRQRGWQVPAYTFPEDMTDTEVMRIVIRNGFSMDLANLLLDDLRLQVRILEHHPQTQPPPEIQQCAGPSRTEALVPIPRPASVRPDQLGGRRGARPARTRTRSVRVMSSRSGTPPGT